ncbi:polyhydroxyalkanoate synthesis regulator DNA-binding domain-containing protein [Polyangium aurulentum]|uniref:polyhydroxyalkanoate synthesis regulator DNA-binding domain-containing protein n=1 Tax=Polyangium aurulentum TaxID=2567896 RepID=UPI00146B1EF7|nr:polyhydroxyalkanoate synthesis regulator DNA-binding domain-containing protein [Polyangium aurulentum]UQA62204.1 polyhydroxyalkanoate synthesis regulator DNA-binding domain-containing protein [Polyangium aurulentum]
MDERANGGGGLVAAQHARLRRPGSFCYDAGPMVVKKYGNRRLYDTEESRYVTLEEVAERIRRGDDVYVVDAKTGHDLTQVTLAQIILESRGAARLLPVPLLRQLIRMGDDALAEFFGRTLSWSLDFYLLAKKGAQVLPRGPFGVMPFMNPFAALLASSAPWTSPMQSSAAPPTLEVEAPVEVEVEVEPERNGQAEEIAALRRELEELKRVVSKQNRSD